MQAGVVQKHDPNRWWSRPSLHQKKKKKNENEYTGKYSEKMQTAKAETKAQYEEYTEQKEKEKREEIKKDVPYKGMERKNLWRLVEMAGLAML